MKKKFVIVLLVMLIFVPTVLAGYVFLTKGNDNVAAPPMSTPINNSEERPSWIDELIAREESTPPANPPASLTKCTYKNQTVYYIPPRCCDISSAVLDDKGEFLCSPDGGITGSGDGKCADFFASRIDCTTVWQDSRSR